MLSHCAYFCIRFLLKSICRTWTLSYMNMGTWRLLNSFSLHVESSCLGLRKGIKNNKQLILFIILPRPLSGLMELSKNLYYLFPLCTIYFIFCSKLIWKFKSAFYQWGIGGYQFNEHYSLVS